MRKATIPIDDHNSHCAEGYIVEYKLTTETEYTRLFPDPLITPIVITNLENDTDYDVRIKRKCCDGQTSAFTSIVVDTTIA